MRKHGILIRTLAVCLLAALMVMVPIGNASAENVLPVIMRSDGTIVSAESLPAVIETNEENPILSITADSFSLYKDDVSYDDQSEAFEYPVFPNTVTVKTTDGTYSGNPFTIWEEINNHYGIDFKMIVILDTWPTVDEWLPGTTHELVFEMNGVQAPFTVTILNKDYVTSVTLQNKTVEEGDCFYDYGSDGSYQRYYDPWPDAMTVKTVDGTFTGSGGDVREKIRSKGKFRSNSLIKDTGYYDEQEINPWKKGKTYTCGYHFGSHACSCKVSIVANTKPYIFEPELNESTAGINVPWSAVDGADKYILYRSVYSGGEWSSWEKVKTTTKTSYVDNVGYTMGTYYQYRVRAHKTDGTYTGYCPEVAWRYDVFEDVPVFNDDSTYTDDYRHVAWAYNNGIVSGTSPTTFSLDGNCTRTQFCIMLWKTMGKPSTDGMECPFTDLGDLSANNRKAIVWAYNQGIVSGTSATTFSPSAKITRAQLAIMVWKAAGKPSVSGMSCPYTDISELSSNNRKAIIWCYNKGMFDSITGKKFSPSTKGTRRLLVAMLYGYAH